MARKNRNRNYNFKTKELVSYEEIYNRLEELKEKAAWPSDDDGSAEDRYERYNELACDLVSGADSADELEEKQEEFDYLSQESSLSEAEIKEFKKYAHRLATYDSFIAPIEEKIDQIMDADYDGDREELIKNFHNEIHTFGDEIFQLMALQNEEYDKINTEWSRSQSRFSHASQAVRDISSNVGSSASSIKDILPSKEDVVNFAAEGYSEAKKGIGKALTTSWKKFTKQDYRTNQNYEDLIEDAMSYVNGFEDFKSNISEAEREMRSVKEDILEPLSERSQSLMVQQATILRKLSYYLAAGREMIRIFEEEVKPEIENAQNSLEEGEQLDEVQMRGAEEIKRGAQELAERIAAISEQQQLSENLTQHTSQQRDQFTKMCREADTFNSTTIHQLKSTMNVLEASVNQLRENIKKLQYDDLQPQMIQAIMDISMVTDEFNERDSQLRDERANQLEDMRNIQHTIEENRILRSESERLSNLRAIELQGARTKLHEALTDQRNGVPGADKAVEAAEKNIEDVKHHHEKAMQDFNKNSGRLLGQGKTAPKPANGDAKPDASEDKTSSETAAAENTDETPKPKKKFGSSTMSRGPR